VQVGLLLVQLVIFQAELAQLQAKEYGGVPPDALAVIVLPVLLTCTSLNPETLQLTDAGCWIVAV
jgi:hypothetical protein